MNLQSFLKGEKINATKQAAAEELMRRRRIPLNGVPPVFSRKRHEKLVRKYHATADTWWR